jgi:transcriptional regulator with XRE-family HTH domain
VTTRDQEFRRFLLMAQFEAKAIGSRIAQARKEAGLTQEQLAELAPFSLRSLQDYEQGTTVPYRQMRDISKLLGKPVEWFLHGDEEEPFDAATLRDHIDRRFDALEERLAEVVRLLDVERSRA